jgi:outer membrane protein TolC
LNRLFLSYGAWLLLTGLCACQAQRPDVARDAERLTELEDAVVFREFPDDAGGAPSSADSQIELTLPKAVRLALMHDPRIQMALAKVRIAEADANQARLLPNPILNIDIRFPQEAGTNTAFEATLTGDLVSLLQKPGLIAAADKRLRGSACDALTVTLDLIGEVQESYASVQSTDEEVKNAEGRLRILEQLRNMANERLSGGEGTRLDVLTLDAQLMQSTLDLDDLRETAVQERLHLARLVGQPGSTADWALMEITPLQGALAPESEWVDLALKNRPEICSKAWELRALGDDLTAAAFSPFVGGEMGVHTEHDPEWRTGPTITVPLPIFDFGQASRAKLEAQRISARHDLAEQQHEIIQDVRSAYATYLHARTSLAGVEGRLRPLQQQQLEQAQRAYRAGETDLTTLLFAESDYQLTLSKVVELREKLVVAGFKLQRSTGGTAIAAHLLTATTQPADDTLPTSRPATGTAP